MPLAADSPDLIASFQALPGRVPEVLWRERVRLFYKHHNPGKEGQVDGVLQQAPGQAATVFRMLEEAYGVRYSAEQEEEAPAVPADSPSATSPHGIGLCRAGGPKARGEFRQHGDGDDSPCSGACSPCSPCSPAVVICSNPASGGAGGSRPGGKNIMERRRRLREAAQAQEDEQNAGGAVTSSICTDTSMPEASLEAAADAAPA